MLLNHENDQMRRLNRWVLVVALLCLTTTLTACNDHDLTAFNASVRSSVTQRTDQIERRPVDIIFMVDNSNSMCEEQSILVQNFNEFIGGLAIAGADFQIAVVNTDATEPTPGAFRNRPGTYEAPGCASPPDTSTCAARQLPPDGIVKSSDLKYAGIDPSNPDTFKTLQDDFACLALTGIDGNGTEMGLETLRQALTLNKATFLRENALLAIVFVTDENDCSDGTLGLTKQGEVYKEVQDASNDRFCEFRRNIEDSCLLSSKNSVPIPFTYTTKDADGLDVEVTESRTGIEWCTLGNRDIVQALVTSGDIEVDCPAEGCANKLTNRQDFYNFLTSAEGLGKKPDDIIIASILNQDSSERYNTDEVEDGRRIPPACGRVDTLGYRYELFTNMFSEKQRVVGAICEAGKPKAFAEDLGLIADTIGAAINSVCLQGKPANCTADGTGDAPCAAGQFCCPGLQLCGRRAETVDCTNLSEEECDAAKADNKRIFFEGTPNEYKLCSGFRVVVGEETELGFTEYEEGPEFTVSYKSADKCGVDTPLEVLFKKAPSENIVVIFPQSLQKNLNQ